MSAPAPRRAAFIFIFATVALDMLALGVMVPVLPKLVVEFFLHFALFRSRSFLERLKLLHGCILFRFVLRSVSETHHKYNRTDAGQHLLVKRGLVARLLLLYVQLTSELV